MKLAPVLLGVSLAANAALIALLASGVSSGSSPLPASPSTTQAASVNASAAAAAAQSWSALQGLELAAQRDRLRAEDFPPSIIRAILAAQIHERFAARRKALEAAQGELPFWKNPQLDPATLAAIRALDKEERQALKDLLGREADSSTAASLHRQFPNFSDGQIDELAGIRERYDEQRQDLYSTAARGGGVITLTPDERAKIAALEKAMHNEFATVLTPAQLEDYDLRTSNTANSLRYSLGNFELNEAEFRSVYKLRAAFDEELAAFNGPGASPEQMNVRRDAQKKLDDSIAAALGPERYAEYQRAMDYNYRQTSQLVARLELPPETADQVYAIQKEIQQRLADAYRASVISGADRNALLAAMATEAQAKLVPLLGERGFEAYKSNGGSWLQSLAPPPRPAPKQ